MSRKKKKETITSMVALKAKSSSNNSYSALQMEWSYLHSTANVKKKKGGKKKEKRGCAVHRYSNTLKSSTYTCNRRKCRKHL